MTAPAWLVLFDSAEPNALIELLKQDREQFGKRTDVLCELLNDYIKEHRKNLKPRAVASSWSYCAPEMLKAIDLLSFLERLPRARIVQIDAVAEKLTALYFEFLEEGTPFTIMHKQRVSALGTAAEDRKAKSKAAHAQWQSWANAIWHENPKWYKNAVAQQIKDQHEIPHSVQWIADQLKRPKSG